MKRKIVGSTTWNCEVDHQKNGEEVKPLKKGTAPDSSVCRALCVCLTGAQLCQTLHTETAKAVASPQGTK